jgi:hypothetical protein
MKNKVRNPFIKMDQETVVFIAIISCLVSIFIWGQLIDPNGGFRLNESNSIVIQFISVMGFAILNIIGMLSTTAMVINGKKELDEIEERQIKSISIVELNPKTGEKRIKNVKVPDGTTSDNVKDIYDKEIELMINERTTKRNRGNDPENMLMKELSKTLDKKDDDKYQCNCFDCQMDRAASVDKSSMNKGEDIDEHIGTMKAWMKREYNSITKSMDELLLKYSKKNPRIGPDKTELPVLTRDESIPGFRYGIKDGPSVFFNMSETEYKSLSRIPTLMSTFISIIFTEGIRQVMIDSLAELLLEWKKERG